jgi:hypothetical protein
MDLPHARPLHVKQEKIFRFPGSSTQGMAREKKKRGTMILTRSILRLTRLLRNLKSPD